MWRNRIQQYARRWERPKAAQSGLIPGFVILPLAMLPIVASQQSAMAQQSALAQQRLYQLAFEQAQQAAMNRLWFGE